MIFDHFSNYDRSSPDRSMRENAGDQADGLRQMRRIEPSHPSNKPEAPSRCEPGGIECLSSLSARVIPWPRVVLISEFPSTDIGARFAWHLVGWLSQQSGSSQSLLIDLSPAASRLPQVLADVIPSTSYAPLWSRLASGRPLVTCESRRHAKVAVAAEAQSSPCGLDQLPRVYEQLVRGLSRQSDRLRWIVMLAVDSVVPLDRACWQAADDVILLHGSEATGCQRQAAALRNRIDEDEPMRSVWTLPKRPAGLRRILSSSWIGGWSDIALSTRWLEAGIVTRLLPAVSWPDRSLALASEQTLREGSRMDGCLMRSARQVADSLRLSAACQNSVDLVSSNVVQKKIQLGQHVRPIKQSTDEFRA